jgi:cytochrome b561
LPVLIAPNPELKAVLKLAHYALNMTLLAGVCLHLLAALKHHFIDRDEILKRMLP